jgi:general stress protein 26
MAQQDKLDRVWDIVEAVGVCMLTTRSPRGLRARPLEPRPDREAGLIWFLTDVRGTKDDEIDAAPEVGITFVDQRRKAYLSITGRATVCVDRAKAAAIWSETDGVWWSGPDDPNLRVLRVKPELAELWDGPASSAVAAFEFAKARATGRKPNLGEKRKATVRMHAAPRRS